MVVFFVQTLFYPQQFVKSLTNSKKSIAIQTATWRILSNQDCGNALQA